MAISSALGSSALLPAGLGFRNVLINGDMQVAQRGTSTTGITTGGYYTCDRWFMNLSSGGTWTQTQSTDAPAGFGNSLRVQCTTANNSLATTNNARIWQKIEGFNVQQLAKGTSSAKPLVLTFWVKAFQTGTFVCTIDDLTNSRKISASYTINASATWEKKTLYFVGDATGVLANNANESLMVQWWLAAGPSFQGSSLSTSWSSSSTLSDYANGQTNVASSTNNYFQITGVQLEQNLQPTPFEQIPVGVELAMCQRYYEKSHDMVQTVFTGLSAQNSSYSGWIAHRVTKRASPTTYISSVPWNRDGKMNGYNSAGTLFLPTLSIYGSGTIQGFSVYVAGSTGYVFGDFAYETVSEL
jgi:hypothetical protein